MKKPDQPLKMPAAKPAPAGGSIDKKQSTNHADTRNEAAVTTNDSSPGLAGAPDADLASDAAAFIGGSRASDAGLRSGTPEIDHQACRLVEWAQRCGLILPDSFFTGLQQHPATTAEHEVFHRPSDNRAIKRSYPGTFGVTPDAKGQQMAATPLFYLHRLAAMNRVFNADLRLEGVAFGQPFIIGQQGLQPSVVISQPWIRAEDPVNPHPTEQEIGQFMDSLGFEPLPNSYFGWHRPTDNVIVVDARADNFIKSAEGVVPIDLVIEQRQSPL
ncbi:MAG: hypothetical protein HZA89_01475 [Verrucomicrobia bacterium]|nr:hypothetical protein [Verrucomicrobiota bacterium]